VNRFISNLILGFFVLALMAVYGFAKQPTVYSMITGQTKQTTTASAGDDTTRRVILPNGTTIAVRVAATEEERLKGLSGVEQLESNAGMLFVFAEPGTYSMWMKGMKIPLDMVWLDSEGRVVHLATQVQPPKDDQAAPPTYINDQPAKYVLELAAGEAEATGTTEGAVLKLS
jgi:hypothetical protein